MPSPQPANDDLPPLEDDTASYIIRSQQRALMNTTGDLDPQAAARSLELGQATGVPAGIIRSDPESFERDYKARLTSQLLRNNQFLMDHASDGLNAEVSSNDWGALSEYGDALKRYTQHAADGLFGAPFRAFKEGFDEESIGKREPTQSDLEFEKNYPNLYAFGKAAMQQYLEVPADLFTHVWSGGLKAVNEGLKASGRGLGMSDSQAESMANDLTGMLEYEMTKGEGKGPGLHEAQRLQVVIPWLRRGEEPPRGVSKDVDDLNKGNSKEGMKALDEVIKARDGAQTFELAPDTAHKDFVKQFGEGHIGISADAVRKLYGDKVPELDDNLLGWVPRIKEQLQSAGQFDDIVVPRADFLSKMPKELYDELHDYIRNRSGAYTLDEAKQPETEAEEPAAETEPAEAPKEEAPTEQPTIVSTLRNAAKLDPAIVDLEALGKEIGAIPSGKPMLVRTADAEATSVASFDFRDAIKGVDFSVLPDDAKLLSDFWGDRISEQAGDVPVHIVTREDFQKLFPDFKGQNIVGMHYIAEADKHPEGIFLSDHLFEQRPDIVAQILLHEGGHAITIRAMQKYPDIAKVIDKMRKDVQTRFQSLGQQDKLKRFDYAFSNEREFWSEGISDPELRRELQSIPVDPQIAAGLKLGGRPKTMWDMFRSILKEIWTRLAGKVPEDSVMDAFFKIGEYLQTINKNLEEMGRGDQLSPAKGPPSREVEGMPAQSASMVDFTKRIIKKHQERIAQRNAEDAEHEQKVAERRAKEVVTKEWKEKQADLRPEVQRDVESRPDIAADRLLQDGIYQGEKIRKPRLEASALTDEQKAALPRNTWGENGVHPDVIAGLVGFPGGGQQLISRLAELHQQRNLEGLTRKGALSKAVDIELQKRMEVDGKLDEKILEEAMDYLPSKTQIDMLSDQAFVLAEMSGQKMPLDLNKLANESFKQTAVGQATRETIFRQLNNAGNAVQEHLRNDKETEAFKAKVDQTISTIKLKDANKLAKERAVWDRNAKMLGRTEITQLDAEYLPWLRQLMYRAGEKVPGRAESDIARDIENAQYKTFEAFVDAKTAMLRELPVWDKLLEKDATGADKWDLRKKKMSIDDLSVEDFRALNSTVKAFIFNAREEKKAYAQGKAEDFEAVMDAMDEQLGTFKEKKEEPPSPGPISKAIKLIRIYGAAHLQMESIFNRIDRGDPYGHFTKYIMRDLIESATNEANLNRKIARMLVSNKYEGNMKEPITNNLIRSPRSNSLIDLKRENLLTAMLYTGTDIRLKKLAEGYDVKPEQMMDWINSQARPEDWKWVRGIWDIYHNLKEESDDMYRRLTGEAPAMEEPRQVETRFGTFEGGYYQLRYDRRYAPEKEPPPDSLEMNGYDRATPSARYTKAVTKYIGAVDLNLDSLPGHMTQMIHDIAFRESVINAGKFFYNKRFQQMFRRNFGDVYGDLLTPYLRDVANFTNHMIRDEAANTYTKLLNTIGQNTVHALTDLNPKTIIKHGSTALLQSIKDAGPNFPKYFIKMFQGNEEIAESNWKFAKEKFDEIARRERNFLDTIGGAQRLSAKGGVTWGDLLKKYGSWFITQSDLGSSVPLALGKYQELKDAGVAEGDAVYEANRAVRRTHGSSVITNLAAVQRSKNPIVNSFVRLFGFYNHMTNRLYEIGWRAHDEFTDEDNSTLDKVKHVPELASGIFSYLIGPAIIGGLVTGWRQNEPWWEWAAKSMAHELAGSWVGIRDIVDPILTGTDFTGGTITTSGSGITNLARDVGTIVKNRAVGRPMFTKRQAGKLALDVFELGGELSGIVNATEGRMAEFLINYYRGQEHPKGWYDIGRGLWYGKIPKPNQKGFP